MDLVFKIESFETFKKASKELLKNLYKSEQGLILEVDKNVIVNAKEDLKNLIFSNDYDIDKVKEQISNKCWDEYKVEWFNAELDKWRNFIFHSILLSHNSRYGDALLDYDWSLKLVFGTSESKSLKYPLFQLMLTMLNSSGNSKDVLFDLNKESLGKLIDALENNPVLN